MELVEVENQSLETPLNSEAFEIGKSEIHCHPATFKLTLPVLMFGVGHFWLETRVIIKISTHPC